ncbi:hypothetical protein IGI04_038384 [Brassica rapa subsp. trilocularis]|uniref:Translation initiation factor IF- 2 domain-containing protein n=1 Tax=Brassica rapa subsp. trilocularis TaxID=1813537 RepID=A0ABQ7LK05_BRACM|nr:hypothetical protein IGI04_038384 [Brassica rapa subsp. trilocularis]
MEKSESAYRIRGATASYLRGKGVVLEEDIRSREYGFYTAMNDVMGCLKKKKEGKEEGVYAIASSFGYLFELVLHLTSAEVNIPVTGLGVGPVTPGDIRKATQRRKHTVLAFQVEVTPKASHLAQTLGVKIICGDTIEHLCQQFQECNKELGEDKKESESDVGTPLCIPHRAFVNIGRVAWIQKDQRPVEFAREGEKVIIKIVAADPKTQQGMLLGIDLDEGDVLVSRTSAVAVYQVEINRQMEKIIELTNKQKNVLIT